MEIKEKVKKYILSNQLIEEGAEILVAFSGGPDSLALLQVLLQLKEELKIKKIGAAHFNHRLRGKESDQEAAHAQEICEVFQVPFYLGEWENPKAGEEEARTARYNFLNESIKDFSPKGLIATAHHLDDQAETILMRLLSGSGSTGLSGIHPKRGNLIRPFLCLNRKEIEEYVSRMDLSPNRDSSNDKNDYLRNRIRHRVIPLLQEENPNLSSTLSYTADLLKEEDRYLNQVAEQVFKGCLLKDQLDLSKVSALDPAIQRRVIQKWLDSFSLSKDFQTVERIQALITGKKTGKKTNVGKNRFCQLDYDRLVISKESEEPVCPSLSFLPIKATESLVKALLKGEFFTKDFPEFQMDSDSYVLLLKQGEEMPLLRHRNEGDFYFYKEGKKKLQDFFTDKKISKTRRDDLWLLAKGSQVLWIPGILRGMNQQIGEEGSWEDYRVYEVRINP